ncbi:MAG: TlpA family protein disulfide reductase [Desulfobacteraceae bacterium]|nr:TlpA family protein disulfide reductase [Desulfobacteraceae bacterium]
MRLLIRMILIMTAISAVLTVLAGCSSAPAESPIPEAAQLPNPESSMLQKQRPADITSTSTPEVTPAPETASEPEVGPQIGKLAPVFKFTNPEGENISLSDFRGNSVVLNFWATWCGPCKFEMPLIQELAHDAERAANGLILMTVNGGESADTVAKFMIEYGFSFPVLLDTQRGITRAYNVRGIPTTFFIDKDGIIRDIKVGAFTSKTELNSKLNNIMD